MKIEDIANLTEGELLNAPAVTAVDAATVYQSKVEQGDAFFSSSQDDIDKAIERGAYAIIFDDPAIVRNDDEIAWIRVDDIQKAAERLLRYIAIQKEARFFYADVHTIDFIKMIVTHKRRIAFLNDDWRKRFESIVNGEADLFVGSDAALLRIIKPDYETLSSKVKGYIIADTLFRTTFKADGFIYQEKELAPFHLDALLRAVAFAKAHDLPYDIDRVRYTRRFIPVFIDGNLHVVPKGRSDKALIFVDNFDDIEAAREYLYRSQRWIKSIVLTPPKTKLPSGDRPVWYETEEQLRDLLKHSFYHYAFIYRADVSILRRIDEQQTLF